MVSPSTQPPTTAAETPVEIDAANARLTYPAARRTDQVDVYHGQSVPDPYRWLEDIDSAETKQWVDAQGVLTQTYLSATPGRQAIADQLAKVWNFERWSLPRDTGGRYIVTHNDGLQNQSVYLTATSATGELKVLLDPNGLSPDGTIAVSGTALSDDGKYLAYGLSDSGSDWQTWYVLDAQTGQTLEDKLEWVKFSGATWTPDGKGFFYERYDAPPPGKALSQINYYQKVFYHVVGTPQSADNLVYERKDQKEWGFSPSVTEDGSYLVIEVNQGTDSRNLVFIQDLRKKKAKTVELIADFEADFTYLGADGSTLYFRTDLDAPRGRVIAIDLKKPARKHWREIVAQQKDSLASVSYVGGRLFLSYLHDAHSRVEMVGLDGKSLGEVQLPGLGSVYGFNGRQDDKHTYFSFTSFSDPGQIYRYDIASGETSLHRSVKLPFDPADFATQQVFYTSKDGTSVPMYITRHKDTKVDGNTPTHLYGYGGFDISLTPGFSPADLVWMQMGGLYVQTNLRGGGEYGQAWHEAGTKTHKQNVFDDFIGAAEYLIANGYTNPKKLAIGGRSNGGLLVGATLVQRPDLFAAAIPGVGVLDMLRFKEFTIGRAWVSDYGTPDNQDEFAALLRYSPYHNVVNGTSYPATMVYTADHDDRVYPAHSFKFGAALQAAQAGDRPILMRIETKAGHGAGMPTTKKIEQWADLWAFLARELEMPVSFQ